MDRYHNHFQLYKYLHLHDLLHNKFVDLLLADTFRLLALSMISIFVPIFLLDKIGLSLMEVAFFELASFVLGIFFHYYLFLPICRIGVRKTLIASYLLNSLTCLILYFGVELHSIIGVTNFIILTAVFNSFPLTLYWSAHHIYFLKCTRSKESGKKLGLLKAIPVFVSISGPFIGGVLITNYSFREVFLFSTFLLLAASVALCFSKDIKIKVKLDWKKVIDADNFTKNAVFFFQGANYCASSFAWPILMFLSSINIALMGAFYLLSNALSAVITYVGGKKVDTKGSSGIIKLGAIGHGLSLFFRAISSSSLFMAAFQSMGGIFGSLMHVGIDSSFFKHSHKNIGNAIINRELYMHLGRIAMVGILILSLIVFDSKIALILSLFFGSFGTMFLSKLVKYNSSYMKKSLFERFKI